jgi:hypothetical protein
MIPRDRFGLPKRSRNDVLEAIFGSENTLFGPPGVQKCLILMIWAVLVDFCCFGNPFWVILGSLGVVLGAQNCPKRPPEDPRSTPDQSPKGVWGTALGPAFLRVFRVALLKNTFFHAFLRAGKNRLIAKRLWTCIFTWFSWSVNEKHVFPCIFTGGKKPAYSKKAWDLHFYMVFVGRE